MEVDSMKKFSPEYYRQFEGQEPLVDYLEAIKTECTDVSLQAQLKWQHVPFPVDVELHIEDGEVDFYGVTRIYIAESSAAANLVISDTEHDLCCIKVPAYYSVDYRTEAGRSYLTIDLTAAY